MTRADAKEVLQSEDGVGNVTSVTPADSAAHTYSYDEVNEVTAYTPPAVTPATQPETTTYDLDGLVTATGHSDGTSTTVTREASGRVSAVVSPWWRNDFTYLPSGQLQTATRGAQTLAWAYDGFLVKTETASGVVSAWNYDSDFRVTSHAIADAGIAYTYDNDSLLTGAGVATLTRSPDSGFLMGVTVGSVATAFGYNGYGEVESVTSGSLYSEGLQYDSAGRLTVIQESVNGTPTQYTYTYDSVGRLTSATKDGTQTTSWTYDGNGNRLTENGVTATFDAQDRLLTKGTTTYTWDALGGRKTKTEGGQTTQYTHDGLGALQSVTLPDSTQVTYEYDARQRRVAKRRNGTVEARWVYDGQYRVAAQLDASGTVTHRFVYGSQSYSPDYVVKGGVTYAYVKNHLGSIRFVVDASTGAVAQQLDYDAWGNVLTDSSPGFQPFAFAGGIYDRDTKLTHFGYRDYDASAGVWTAKDQIRLSGGTNTTSYVGARPTEYGDPMGLGAVRITGPQWFQDAVNDDLASPCGASASAAISASALDVNISMATLPMPAAGPDFGQTEPNSTWRPTAVNVTISAFTMGQYKTGGIPGWSPREYHNVTEVIAHEFGHVEGILKALSGASSLGAHWWPKLNPTTNCNACRAGRTYRASMGLNPAGHSELTKDCSSCP